MDCFLHILLSSRIFRFYGGIDLRYYKGLHQNIITDPYNGAYFVDPNCSDIKADNNPLANDPNYVNQKLGCR